MKIVFVHYHLQPGGVTAVLRQQVEAINDTCDVLVLAGTSPESSFPCDAEVISGLGYDGPEQEDLKPKDVAESIIEAIGKKWTSGCDLIHVHNPTLAKNSNFLRILETLKYKKIKLFLQIHDFAEDGRPLSYFSDDDYLSDSHYGVINSRDYNVLLRAGLRTEGLHKIPNAIEPFTFSSPTAPTRETVLYPVRAIRRKNVGEAILLSLFFKENESLAVTLPPNSPVDIRSYEGWKAFVKEEDLNVVFDAGLKQDFSELVMSSKFIITTSITEGFGFSFLEPWTGKKMLLGRNLPVICSDFEQNGVRLDHLYVQLDVPIEWLGKEKLLEKWQTCVEKAGAKFNRVIHETKITSAFEKTIENNIIDFGLLDEAFQKTIIFQVISDQKNRDRLTQLNPCLLEYGDVPNKKTLIKNNMNAVLANYNKSIYRERLIDIYTKVIKHSVRHSIDKNALLSQFFIPETFSLLKWGDYVE